MERSERETPNLVMKKVEEIAKRYIKSIGKRRPKHYQYYAKSLHNKVDEYLLTQDITPDEQPGVWLRAHEIATNIYDQWFIQNF